MPGSSGGRARTTGLLSPPLRPGFGAAPAKPAGLVRNGGADVSVCATGASPAAGAAGAAAALGGTAAALDGTAAALGAAVTVDAVAGFGDGACDVPGTDGAAAAGGAAVSRGAIVSGGAA